MEAFMSNIKYLDACDGYSDAAYHQQGDEQDNASHNRRGYGNVFPLAPINSCGVPYSSKRV
jgi:hypothetical protein